MFHLFPAGTLIVLYVIVLFIEEDVIESDHPLCETVGRQMCVHHFNVTL